MLGLADRYHRFFGQRRRRAGLHAGATGDAFGINETLVHARGDARAKTAALDGQREGALHLLTGIHATGADDAFGRVIGEIGIGLVLRHPFQIDLAIVAVPQT